MIETGEETIKIPEQNKELEDAVRSVVSNEDEVQTAMEITRAVLEAGVKTADVVEDNWDYKKLVRKKVGEHGDEVVAQKLAEQEARYERFIQEGRKFYEQELESIGRDETLDEDEKEKRK
ncbi:MAG: hypothetical protein HQ530_02555, partial [Parcubacteria group bacterium]|nr:hypothetical protein [Parcubacteria group bacterium]